MPVNIFKRKVTEKFDEWLPVRDDKLLLIHGARKIGKTYEAKSFAKKNFSNVIYLDLAEVNYDIIHKLMLFNIAYNNDTVVIIDNIQLKPMIYKLLLAFYRYMKYSIILISDELVFRLNDMDTFNTYDSVISIKFYPMSFNEFCAVFNKEKCDDKSTIISMYNVYRIIGGYPEVIDTFLYTKQYTDCKFVLSDILNDIVEDYYKHRQTIINKYGYSAISDYKFDYSDALINAFGRFISIKEKSIVVLYLYLCGVIDFTSVIDGKDRVITNNKRFFLNDVGMLNYISGIVKYDPGRSTGTLTECFVFNDLVHNYDSSFLNNRLYYILYDEYELDFAIMQDKSLIGLEVKTNKGKAKSLRFFNLISFIKTGIKVGMYSKTYVERDNIYTHPVYRLSDLDINKLLNASY